MAISRPLRSIVYCILLVLPSIGLFAEPVWPDVVMDRIRQSGEIRVGVRQDAFPFAFLDSDTGRYSGFAVDMAHLLAAFLSKRLERTIHLRPVPVTAKNRIDMVRRGVIDVEMGASSLNQSREALVDFSLIFFISETTFLVGKNSGIAIIGDLNGKTIGAARGTTNLEVLNTLVATGRVVPQAIVLTDTHAEGMQALQQSTIDAYCSDRILLNVMRHQTAAPDNWIALDHAVAYEPYAFMLPEGSSDFRDFLNDTIRWTVSSGQFDEIYDRWMGPQSLTPYKMPPALKEYFQVIVYPMTPSWWREK